MTTRSGRTYQPNYSLNDHQLYAIFNDSPNALWFADHDVKEEVKHGEDPADNKCMDYSTESEDEGYEGLLEGGGVICNCGEFKFFHYTDMPPHETPAPRLVNVELNPGPTDEEM
jgi:hypothetical protein